MRPRLRKLWNAGRALRREREAAEREGCPIHERLRVFSEEPLPLPPDIMQWPEEWTEPEEAAS